MKINTRVYENQVLTNWTEDPVFKVLDKDIIEHRNGGAIVKFNRVGIIPPTKEHVTFHIEECECSGDDYVQVVAGTSGEKLRPYFVNRNPEEYGVQGVFMLPNRILTARVLLKEDGSPKGFTILKHLLRKEALTSGYTHLSVDRVEIFSGENPEEISAEGSKYPFLRHLVDAVFAKSEGKAGMYYGIPKDNLPPRREEENGDSPFKVLVGKVGTDDTDS